MSPFVFVYLFSGLFGLANFHLIKTYHESKALGMQTFLSKTIVVFVDTTKIVLIVGATSFSIGEADLDLHSKIAFALAFIEITAAFMFYAALLVVSATKYLTIYWTNIVNDVNEDVMLPVIKRTVVMFPTMLATVEFTSITDLESTASYCLLTSGSMSTLSGTGSCGTFMGYFLPGLAVISFIAALGLQIRLELDKDKFFPVIVNHQQSQENHNNEYKITVLRTILVLASLLMIVLALQLVFHIVSFRLSALIFYVILGDVCPLVFICSHRGIRQHSYKMICAHWKN